MAFPVTDKPGKAAPANERRANSESLDFLSRSAYNLTIRQTRTLDPEHRTLAANCRVNLVPTLLEPEAQLAQHVGQVLSAFDACVCRCKKWRDKSDQGASRRLGSPWSTCQGVSNLNLFLNGLPWRPS